MTPSLPPLISAGYYLTTRTPRPTYTSARLLPESLITFSDCIGDFVPGTCCMDRSSNECLERFGLDEQTKTDVGKWMTRALEQGLMGWPNVFLNLDTARQFFEAFLRHPSLMLLGLAVSADELEPVLEETASSHEQSSGLYQMLNRHDPVANGRLLGFDVLGLDIGGFHSYLCNGLETAFETHCGATPNEHGLYAEQDAKQCADFAGLDSTGAEPVLWSSWAVVSYDLSLS